jgi:hypothetical protein
MELELAAGERGEFHDERIWDSRDLRFLTASETTTGNGFFHKDVYESRSKPNDRTGAGSARRYGNRRAQRGSETPSIAFIAISPVPIRSL